VAKITRTSAKARKQVGISAASKKGTKPALKKAAGHSAARARKSGRGPNAAKPQKSSKVAKARKPTRTTRPARQTKRAAATKNPAVTPLDLSNFPAESLTQSERWICLACVWEVFTRHMGLAARTALLEIKRYTPSIAELSAPAVARPYFQPENGKEPCPYCGSSSKWHARMHAHRIESGKATDALRRELLKSLSKSNEQFVVLEQKSTQQEAFFDWLERISKHLDLDNPAWLSEASLHYLSRKEPKIDWKAEFEHVRSIRRSRRLEDGWEIDAGRLFLAPLLFDELLLVQYLLSRSHRAGGLTLERRFTLPELWHRLRNSGYLREVGVTANNPSDALEQLLVYLSGGEASVRYYYIVDRRGYLETAKLLSAAKVK